MLSRQILFGLFLLLSHLLFAQNNEPCAVLVNEHQQKFAASLHRDWQSEQIKLQSLIDKKKLIKWSKDKLGNITLLYGFSPSGLPEYITTAYSTPAAATVGTDKLWEFGSNGLDLSGNNFILKNRLAMWDGGRALPTHIELSGKITAGDSDVAVSGHSTSVAGIMIDKAINPDARGMAYGLGGIISYDFYNDVAEMASASSNLLFSNHSYVHICGWNYRNTSNPDAPHDGSFGADLMMQKIIILVIITVLAVMLILLLLMHHSIQLLKQQEITEPPMVLPLVIVIGEETVVEIGYRLLIVMHQLAAMTDMISYQLWVMQKI